MKANEKITAPSFRLKVDDAIVKVEPCFTNGRLFWDYTVSNVDGSGYFKDWHPNLSSAKDMAATAYRVKFKKRNYRACWIKEEA